MYHINTTTSTYHDWIYPRKNSVLNVLISKLGFNRQHYKAVIPTVAVPFVDAPFSNALSHQPSWFACVRACVSVYGILGVVGVVSFRFVG